MGAKLKSKTHLLNRFWYFEPFFARLASKILKITTRTQFFFIKKKVISHKSTDRKIWYQIEYLKNFFALISTFLKLCMQMRTKCLKKRKTFFYKRALEELN